MSCLTAIGVGSCSISVEGKPWTVLVPSVIPGEVVKVRVTRSFEDERRSEADLISVVSASPSRVVPKCKIGDCGGCQFQHIDAQWQRRWKKDRVLTLFATVSPSLSDADIRLITKDTLGTEDVYGYRSKLSPHYRKPKEGEGELGPIGFLSRRGRGGEARQLIDVPQCAIASPAINEKLKLVRTELRENFNSETTVVPYNANLLFRGCKEGVAVDRNAYVTESLPSTVVGELTFRFKAGNFFQNNAHMLPVMVDYVLSKASFPNRAGEKMTHLVDAYCGSGLFAISSSRLFDKCVGIEVNGAAIAEARENARINGAEHCCEFIAASSEVIFEGIQSYPRDTTTVVMDPPRKGSSEEFLTQLINFRPERVVYMSCGPDTQARDASFILRNGNYKLIEIQPLDLFPQTRHIENCAVFEYAGKR